MHRLTKDRHKHIVSVCSSLPGGEAVGSGLHQDYSDGFARFLITETTLIHLHDNTLLRLSERRPAAEAFVLLILK